jgi:ATP-dependent Clp protease ATP-binding subunit ClpA
MTTVARADLLRRLFRSYKGRNDPAFLEAAREIAEEERKKHHPALADDLLRILANGTSVPANGHREFEQLPKDSDRGSPLLDIRRPDRYLRDLVLPPTHVDVLNRVIEEFRQWDVLEASRLRPGNKLLFCGPPGCGKTATAEGLSGEVGLPLVTVRFDAVVSSLLGETAANLRKVFDYVSRGSWVVLFDEFDAIGRSRDDPAEHGELRRVVNTFLQMLDRFAGRSIVVAATNFERSLDRALWRRFDEVVRFERPNREDAQRLIQLKLCPVRVPDAAVRAAAELVDGMAHADIERACVDVLKRAALGCRKAVTGVELAEAVGRQQVRRQVLDSTLDQQPGGVP